MAQFPMIKRIITFARVRYNSHPSQYNLNSIELQVKKSKNRKFIRPNKLANIPGLRSLSPGEITTP